MNTQNPMITDEDRRLFRPVCCKTDEEWAAYEDYMDGIRDEDQG